MPRKRIIETFHSGCDGVALPAQAPELAPYDRGQGGRSVNGLSTRNNLHRLLSAVILSLLPVLAAGSFTLFSALFPWGPTARAVNIGIGHPPPIEVYFSPRSGSTTAIVQEIDRARSEVLVQAYSFTSVPIARALLKAHRRGIKVEVILDKSQKTQRYSSFSFLANARIPTYIDAEHAIAHSKIILIDQSVVITGSFNFTKAAEEKNAENLLIIRSEELARQFIGNWRHHRSHSAA